MDSRIDCNIEIVGSRHLNNLIDAGKEFAKQYRAEPAAWMLIQCSEAAGHPSVVTYESGVIVVFCAICEDTVAQIEVGPGVIPFEQQDERGEIN